MDYHRLDGQGRRVAIAITRLPAKVPVTDPRYGGVVFLNSGMYLLASRRMPRNPEG
jgi:hypothetical protein